jgi:hypothetical protein
MPPADKLSQEAQAAEVGVTLATGTAATGGPDDAIEPDLIRDQIRDEIAGSERQLTVAAALKGADQDAWKSFGDAVQTFATELADETARLEQASRALGRRRAEVTPEMIGEANAKCRYRASPVPERPVSKWTYSIRVTAFLSALGVGTLGNYLHSNVQSGAFTAILMIAILTNTLVIIGRPR